MARLLERGDPDRAEQVSVLPRSRAVREGAELGAVARPRQDGGEDPHNEREARALVAPDRLEEPPERGGRLGRRPSLGVEGPALRDRQPLLLVDADLPVGRVAEGRVHHDRPLFGGGDRHRQRVDAEDLVDRPPRGHRRQCVGRGEPDHVLGEGQPRVVGHGAAVVAPANGGHRDVRGPRPLDRPPHREGRADLPHAVAAVDEDGGRRLPDDPRPAAGVDLAVEEPIGVLGDPQHAMRVNALEVRRHQRVAEQGGVVG